MSVFIKPSTSIAQLKNTIIQKLGVHDMKWVKKLFYRIQISIVRDVLFHCCRQFSEVRTHEMLAKFGDMVFSSEGLNQNPQSVVIPGASS
ncbi:hypothetical protein Ahy_B09g097661 [Arachis hypogaea]|uniref:Uncharacterized protein n=1 Tax=Arachis hypogaea TaxID=3818 RepID=A0A444XQ54_ARAHY|nr:hypothetical protein Ahy_B09g097661 [Arachis hypogaea]